MVTRECSENTTQTLKVTVAQFQENIVNILHQMKHLERKERRVLKSMSDCVIKILPLMHTMLRFSRGALPEMPGTDDMDYYLKRLKRMAEQNADVVGKKRRVTPCIIPL